MTTAAAHSHHSRRSIRRKFARRAALCASPILPTVFALRSRNHHLLIFLNRLLKGNITISRERRCEQILAFVAQRRIG